MFAVDLLIFDLDGTLCDTKEDIATSLNLTLKELRLPEKPPKVIYGYVGSGVRKLLEQALDMAQNAAHSYGRKSVTPQNAMAPSQGGEGSGERFKEAMRIFRGHYNAHLLDTTKLYPGLETVLNHFQQKKKAVVTNKPQDYTNRILNGLGLTRYFDLVLGGDNGHPLKPDPQMILTVLDRLGSDPARTVMIGDGLHDIVAARAAGIKVCAVGYGLGDPQQLKRAKPDFFSERPEELTWLFV